MKQCAGCGQYEAWCTCPHVLGFKVVLDERMGRDQVGLVNEDERGVSIQQGEITPFIRPLDGEEESTT